MDSAATGPSCPLAAFTSATLVLAPDPDWTNVICAVPALIIAYLEAADELADAVHVIEPFPFPVAPVLMVSQGAEDVAIHSAAAGETLTEIVPVPPVAATLFFAGDGVKVSAFAAGSNTATSYVNDCALPLTVTLLTITV